MSSSRTEASAPAGVKRCVCVQAANGPFNWRSRNCRPGTTSNSSATQSLPTGPAIFARRVTRWPSPNPPAIARTVTRSHGGMSREKAAGRACQSKTAAAETGTGERTANRSIVTPSCIRRRGAAQRRAAGIT